MQRQQLHVTYTIKQDGRTALISSQGFEKKLCLLGTENLRYHVVNKLDNTTVIRLKQFIWHLDRVLSLFVTSSFESIRVKRTFTSQNDTTALPLINTATLANSQNPHCSFRRTLA
jgi:hypothetical protein